MYKTYKKMSFNYFQYPIYFCISNTFTNGKQVIKIISNRFRWRRIFMGRGLLIWSGVFLLSECEFKTPQPIVNKSISFTHNLENALHGNIDFPNQSLQLLFSNHRSRNLHLFFNFDILIVLLIHTFIITKKEYNIKILHVLSFIRLESLVYFKIYSY